VFPQTNTHSFSYSRKLIGVGFNKDKTKDCGVRQDEEDEKILEEAANNDPFAKIIEAHLGHLAAIDAEYERDLRDAEITFHQNLLSNEDDQIGVNFACITALLDPVAVESVFDLYRRNGPTIPSPTGPGNVAALGTWEHIRRHLAQVVLQELRTPRWILDEKANAEAEAEEDRKAARSEENRRFFLEFTKHAISKQIEQLGSRPRGDDADSVIGDVERMERMADELLARSPFLNAWDRDYLNQARN
jgi:hypothetical protein